MGSRVIGSVLVAAAIGALVVGDSDLGARARLAAFGASAMARADTWFRWARLVHVDSLGAGD
jgi:hypothetical protein